jgi:DNA primase catalytic subunit
MDKGVLLRYYKRKDIQEAMVEHCQNREFGTRYGDSFGKRPDILNYPKEVIELVMQGATSFHCSEERWSNPLELSSEIKKKEIEELRCGWDLVLDIDCPDWELSKIITHLCIKALKDNYITNVSCKFSGNKGFHIGVSFESFPKHMKGVETKLLFPEAPKKIAFYLLDFITHKYVSIENDRIVFDNKYRFSLEKLKIKFGEKKFIINRCGRCKREVSLTWEGMPEFICPKCDKKLKSDKNFVKCENCQILMCKVENKNVVNNEITLCKCGSNECRSIFNPLSIIEMDTLLIAPRHLYRTPYSLHEKSSLASVIIEPDKVMEFSKEMAKPEKVEVSGLKFLGREVTEENGGRLLLQALDFEVKGEEKDYDKKEFKGERIIIEGAIKEKFFPPCMKKILCGLNDGRKRAVFCMMDFLGKIGWEKKEIQSFLLKWNQNQENNKESLRENTIISQLNYFKGDKLPPNCDNEAYYKDVGVCEPDGLCKKIKNPVNYAIIRWKMSLKDKKEKEKK